VKLFETRRIAIAELESTLSREAEVIEEMFCLIDRCVEELEAAAKTSPLARVARLTSAKARLLAQGCYSLILDGLGQESGAMLRPLLETVELLVYFRSDSRSLEEALSGNLPSPGVIARRTNGPFQQCADTSMSMRVTSICLARLFSTFLMSRKSPPSRHGRRSISTPSKQIRVYSLRSWLPWAGAA
jgi:hypothetical protein